MDHKDVGGSTSLIRLRTLHVASRKELYNIRAFESYIPGSRRLNSIDQVNLGAISS